MCAYRVEHVVLVTESASVMRVGLRSARSVQMSGRVMETPRRCALSVGTRTCSTRCLRRVYAHASVHAAASVLEWAQKSVREMETIKEPDDDGTHPSCNSRAVEVEGRARGVFGLQGGFSMCVSSGGSFSERVCVSSGKQKVSYAIGCRIDDDVDECWEVDVSGWATTILRESRELVLLASWLRNGQWLQPEILAKLNVCAVQEASDGNPNIHVSLRDGKLCARVRLAEEKQEANGSSFVPIFVRHVEIETAQGTAKWQFQGDWSVVHGVTIPQRALHTPPVAGSPSEIFEMRRVNVIDATETMYEKPQSDDDCGPRVVYHEKCAARCKSARGEGAHILIRGKLGGVDVGWFIVDTAGSGTLAITRQAADRAGLHSFGETYMNGIGDAPIQAALRRGVDGSGNLHIGQVELIDPLFVELELDGAIRYSAPMSQRNRSDADASDEVVGVVGCAWLNRGIFVMRSHKRSPGSPKPGSVSIDFYSPAYFYERRLASDMTMVAWQQLEFINGTPHMFLLLYDGGFEASEEETTISLSGIEESRPGLEKCLVQISLGVGGTELVLRKQVVQRLGIDGGTGNLLVAPSGLVSGSGSSAARMQSLDGSAIVSLRVPLVEALGNTFRFVRAIVHLDGEPRDLELSVYASGLVCAGILRGCTFVLDTGAKRVSVTPVDSWYETNE